MILPDEQAGNAGAFAAPKMVLIPATANFPIRTATGCKRCSNLRPGDWLKIAADESTAMVCVMINSPKLGRAVIRWVDINVEDSLPYAAVAIGFVYIGRGNRRAWYRFMPKWIRNRICEFSLP